MSVTAKRLLHLSWVAAFSMFFYAGTVSTGAQENHLKADSSPVSSPEVIRAASSDPVLHALYDEIERSKSQLKMENVPAPYYIEYRLSDVDEYDAEANFGELRQKQRVHTRTLRVVVRVGDYKEDSYYGPGTGVVDLGPLDDDAIALRRQVWLATDRAYKMTSEALASKKALLRQFTAEQPFDDFARASALQSVAPLLKLDFDPNHWDEIIEKSSALYRTDPKIQSLSAFLQFRVVNQYFVNTEGTVTRQGYAIYFLGLNGLTQAADGMSLDRSPFYTAGSLKELPTEEQLQTDTAKMLETLKKLREAPVVEEDYQGPVLFSSDAASDVFNAWVGRNILGVRPRLGDSARTQGAFSPSYKSRVLPGFLSVVDDPSLKSFQGKTLLGSYEIDDEGVRASKVAVIQDGVLANFLMGRELIRDFPESNGHGRAGPGQAPVASFGNLIVESKQTNSPEELKKKLIEICQQEGKPYGYYVETLSGSVPRLLYRVYVKDGHEELVRGAEFKQFDTRTLRNNLVAAGNDFLVSNRADVVPKTVIAPSILFDEIEVKHTDVKNSKLPEYPPPDFVKSN